MRGDWAGESSRCEDPAPTVGMGGDSVATYASDHHLRPHGHQRERRRRITTRRAASLRPPRTGRIGFKPPYSQKGPRRKTRRGQSFIGAFLTGREVSITQFRFSKTVAMRRACEVCRMESHFYQFSRLAIALLVGEVPSAASARPNQRGVPSLPVPR